jgi:protein-disulfide isomerase
MALHTHASVTATLLALVVLGGCGPNAADVEELKKGQKDILAKLESLDKAVQQVKAAPAPASARPQVDPSKVYTIPVGTSPVKGPKDAKVTIVKFSDYQCPFCSQAATMIDEVLKGYPRDVSLVYKQFPLTSIHPNALPAAKAALAAGKQGKYWEMHALLFQNQRELGPEKYKELAGRIGLDVARWEKDLSAPDIAEQITRETAEARAADVTGTPTFFVNGKRVMNRSVDGFKQMIDEALKS